MRKWGLVLVPAMIALILFMPIRRLRRDYVYPGDLFTPPIIDRRFFDYLVGFKDFRGKPIRLPSGALYRYVPLAPLLPLVEATEFTYLTCSGSDHSTNLEMQEGTGIDFDFAYVTNKTGPIWKIGGFIPPPSAMVALAIEHNLPRDMTLLKLDFDGWECDVLEAFLQYGFRPRIVIIELNPALPPPLRFSMHYDPQYQYTEGAPLFYGCSIQYATELLHRYNYGLIQYVAVDGYFMRNDYLERSILAPMDTFSMREHYRRGNPTFWGSLGCEKLHPRVNVVKEWFEMTNVEELKRVFIGNLTRLHGKLVERGKYTLI
jgi:hypothetical protein